MTRPARLLTRVLLLLSCFSCIVGAQAAGDEPSIYLEQRELGISFAKQARAKFAEVDKDSDDAQENAQIRAEVRSLYAKARDAFAASIRDAERAKPHGRDRQLEGTYVELRLSHATILREIAWTYAKNDAERVNAFGRAAKAFQDLHRAYRRRLVGLHAQLCEADCYREMGNLDQALTIYEELLALDETIPQLRSIRLGALRHAMACWLDKRHRDYDRLIREGSTAIDNATELDRDDPKTLAIRFPLAIAYFRRAVASKDEAQQTQDFRLAADHAHYVAKLDKQRAEAAQKLLRHIPAEIVTESEKDVRQRIDDLPAVGRGRAD